MFSCKPATSECGHASCARDHGTQSPRSEPHVITVPFDRIEELPRCIQICNYPDVQGMLTLEFVPYQQGDVKSFTVEELSKIINWKFI